MNKQEIRIVTKIIREISLFLMLNGYKHYRFDMKIENKTAYFTFRFETPENDLIDRMEEKLMRERELEVETYGWELVGDVDAKSELEIVGLLIDDMVVKREDGDTVVTLVRTSRYKETKQERSKAEEN